MSRDFTQPFIDTLDFFPSVFADCCPNLQAGIWLNHDLEASVKEDRQLEGFVTQVRDLEKNLKATKNRAKKAEERDQEMDYHQ